MESPDGKLFYFTRGTGSSLWRMPVEGGEEKQVLESLHDALYDVAEDGVYFIPASTPEAGFSVEFLRFATGAVEPIFDLEGLPGGDTLSVSPDGRSILYSQGEKPEGDHC